MIDEGTISKITNKQAASKLLIVLYELHGVFFVSALCSCCCSSCCC